MFQYCYLQKDRYVLFVPIQTFFWSVICMILVSKLCLIFQTLQFMSSVDIGDFQLLGYSEGSVSILSYFFSCFFPVSKLYNFGLQIIPPISDHLKFMASVDFGDFQWLGYYEGSVSILSYFSSCFFLVCKLYKSGLYILIF